LSVQKVLDRNVVDILVSIDGGVPEDILCRTHELLRVLVAQCANMVTNVGSLL
jgi:hypothetical protein